MKSNIIIAIVLLAAPMALFAQNSGDFAVPFSDPNKRGKVYAHLNSGSITIKGTGRKDVLVKYAGENDDDKDKGRNRDGLRRISGGTLDLQVAESNNLIKISSGSWNNSTNLEIEVPTGVDLKVHTDNDGTLRISNIQGEVELDNYNGDIYANNISGSAVATSYNGEIKITFDNVSPDTPMSYTTYNGDVDLSFPSTTKATFKMKTNQGEILSGFDMNLIRSEPIQKKDERSGVYKVTVNDWVKGEINGGGPEIVMKSYNGDLYIRKK